MWKKLLHKVKIKLRVTRENFPETFTSEEAELLYQQTGDWQVSAKEKTDVGQRKKVERKSPLRAQI